MKSRLKKVYGSFLKYLITKRKTPETILKALSLTAMIFKAVKWVYKKACALRRKKCLARTASLMIILMIYMLYSKRSTQYDAAFARETIDKTLEENLLIDKGSGCDIAKLDPFAPEMMAHVKEAEPIRCKGVDWVHCHMSKCSINPEILRSVKVESCTFRDILYKSDVERTLGPPTVLKPNEEYTLDISDSVVVQCSGEKNLASFFTGAYWQGVVTGFRKSVTLNPPPQNRENTINVLMLGFDSAAKNGFIRKMPRSYQFLTEELKATVLNGYNIVGDGTPQALFPMLTGKTELEMPDVRKSINKNAFIDHKYFIFDKLKKDGYRTAFFEDRASIGTFQYRFNGFQHQPADHYLFPFFKELLKVEEERTFCVGDTPTYAKLLSLTDQFFRHEGKRFSFTFTGLTHDDINKLGVADNDTADFLRGLRSQGRLRDTMLIVLGDHGPRFDNIRRTFQGKLEERLPLMAIRLPEDLKRRRPGIQKVLESNAEVLTTPHDIYATLLDALDLTEYWNSYKIKGSELTRALSLLKPIPRTRSCSEAGIEPHWCTCLKWEEVPASDPVYTKSAQALVNRINEVTEPVRDRCAVKSLTSIQWVMNRIINTEVIEFQHADDSDGYFGIFQKKHVKTTKTTLQVKVRVFQS